MLVNSVGLNWFFYGGCFVRAWFVLGGNCSMFAVCDLFYVWFGLIGCWDYCIYVWFWVFVVVGLVISLVGLIVLV